MVIGPFSLVFAAGKAIHLAGRMLAVTMEVLVSRSFAMVSIVVQLLPKKLHVTVNRPCILVLAAGKAIHLAGRKLAVTISTILATVMTTATTIMILEVMANTMLMITMIMEKHHSLHVEEVLQYIWALHSKLSGTSSKTVKGSSLCPD